MTPKWAAAKLAEINNFLVEQALDEFLKKGGKVSDLPSDSPLRAKYAEYHGDQETPEQARQNKKVKEENVKKYESEIAEIAKSREALLGFFDKSEVKF